MKKIDYSPITSTAQMPFKQGSLKHLQEAYQEPISQICINLINQLLLSSYSSTTAYILWGVQAFPGSPNTLISQGAIFYNGEIYLVDSQTITSPTGSQVIVSDITTTFYTDTSADPVTFTDLSTHSVHQIRKVTFRAANTGTGSLGDFTGNSSIYRTLQRIPEFQSISTNIGFGSPQVVSFASNQYINFSGPLTGACSISFSFANALPGTKVTLEMPMDNTGGLASITVDSSGGGAWEVYTLLGNLTVTGIQFKFLEFTYVGSPYFGKPLVQLRIYPS